MTHHPAKSLDIRSSNTIKIPELEGGFREPWNSRGAFGVRERQPPPCSDIPRKHCPQVQDAEGEQVLAELTVTIRECRTSNYTKLSRRKETGEYQGLWCCVVCLSVEKGERLFQRSLPTLLKVHNRANKTVTNCYLIMK